MSHVPQALRVSRAPPAAILCHTTEPLKDQSYFLAHLSSRQLSACMFPLGSLSKARVRRLAAHVGLPSAGRKDSQGICFLGKVKFGEFVR